MATHTFTLTVEQIVDDAHLDEIVDAINELGYVSNISKVATADVAPNLDPLPYTPAGYQWEGCRSAWPKLRNGVLDEFAPRQGYSQDQDDYA